MSRKFWLDPSRRPLPELVLLQIGEELVEVGAKDLPVPPCLALSLVSPVCLPLLLPPESSEPGAKDSGAVLPDAVLIGARLAGFSCGLGIELAVAMPPDSRDGELRNASLPDARGYMK